MSICLYTIYIYFTDIHEVERANLGPFHAISDLPHWGGQNRKNRDSARTRCAVASPFEAPILVPICVESVLLPRRHISRFRFGRCGHIGVQFCDCNPTLWVGVLQLYYLILMTYTSKFLCFLQPQVWVCLLYTQIKIPG